MNKDTGVLIWRAFVTIMLLAQGCDSTTIIRKLDNWGRETNSNIWTATKSTNHIVNEALTNNE